MIELPVGQVVIYIGITIADFKQTNLMIDFANLISFSSIHNVIQANKKISNKLIQIKIFLG